MAIRLRKVEGILIALCAAETDPQEGDVYLDDDTHYALAAKFARDWRDQIIDWIYEKHDRLAETQKIRDAREELDRWLDALDNQGNEGV